MVWQVVHFEAVEGIQWGLGFFVPFCHMRRDVLEEVEKFSLTCLEGAGEEKVTSRNEMEAFLIDGDETTNCQFFQSKFRKKKLYPFLSFCTYVQQNIQYMGPS